MATDRFDAEGFYLALDSVRNARKLNWKQVANATKVSASTLTRMAQGRRPDVDSLAALATWAGLSTDQFMGYDDSQESEQDTLGAIRAQFRRDRNLTPQAKKAIEAALVALYGQLSKEK